MPSKIRLELNNEGIREVLRSDEMRAVIAARAERIAAAARAKTGDEITVTNAGRSRARSYVTRSGSGAQGEANDRALGSSIDAGRE